MPRFVSGLRAGCKRYTVVHGVGVVACDEPTNAVGNSRRTTVFIIRGQFHRWQVGWVTFLRPEPLQTRMWLLVVELLL